MARRALQDPMRSASLFRSGNPYLPDACGVYKQPLQQSDEALRRLVKLIGEDIRLPDFFIFSRRGFEL